MTWFFPFHSPSYARKAFKIHIWIIGRCSAKCKQYWHFCRIWPNRSFSTFFKNLYIDLPIDDVSFIGMSVLKCPDTQLPKTGFRINYFLCFITKSWFEKRVNFQFVCRFRPKRIFLRKQFIFIFILIYLINMLHSIEKWFEVVFSSAFLN